MKENFDNIIFISGVKTPKSWLKNWREILVEKFPHSEIHIIDIFYSSKDLKKILEVKEKVLKILEENKSTILIGHSFGGLLAVSGYLENIKKRNNIKKIITMGSPHILNSKKRKKIKTFLNYEIANIEIPVFTFGGYFDGIVFFTKTKYKNSFHKNYFVKHNSFLFSKKIIKKVLNKI